MKFYSRLAPIATLLALFAPSLALADVDVRSCCVLTSGTRVNSCFQFTDALQGTPSESDKNTARQFQQYKCQNVPFLYSSEQGKTASWVSNDAQNSGVCGNGSSTACAGSAVQISTVHAKCQSDSDCGTASAYVCQGGFCKIKDGQGCIGSDGAQVNCANGLICRATPNGTKCLSATADVNASTSNGSGSITVGQNNAPFTPVVPQLGVPIPGFSFTTATEEDGVVSVPYLAQYVNAVYRYMTAVVLVIAIVMVTYGGFRYLLAATPLGVKESKEIIIDAIVGMGLVLGAYVILNTVNPATLSLQTLHLQRVQSQEFAMSMEFGGAADDDAYAPEDGASATPAPAGSWRASALAVCGDSNVSGMSLDQRKGRLKAIVNAWTNLASTQAGSVYIRGGTLSCSPATAEFKYKAHILNGIKRSGYTVNVPPECLNEETAVTDSNCHAPLAAEYSRLAARPAATNGLICGDCQSYQMSVMKCFGGNAYAQLVRNNMPKTSNGAACTHYTPGPDDVAFIKTSGNRFSDADIQSFVGRLQFGDIVYWSSDSRVRHAFMYTGGAGLPYQIVEMGAGGQGDVIGGSDGRRYWSHVGLPNFDGSHVKAHSDAAAYLTSSSFAGARCLKAVRIIDN